jgi:hypothetical protein
MNFPETIVALVKQHEAGSLRATPVQLPPGAPIPMTESRHRKREAGAPPGQSLSDAQSPPERWPI